METLQKSFAMLMLALISNWPRERLEKLPPEFKCEAITDSTTIDSLSLHVLNGDVTCIVPNPEPYTFLKFAGMRTVWGIWVGRTASWRGKHKAPERAMKPPSEAQSQYRAESES